MWSEGLENNSKFQVVQKKWEATGGKQFPTDLASKISELKAAMTEMTNFSERMETDVHKDYLAEMKKVYIRGLAVSLEGRLIALMSGFKDKAKLKTALGPKDKEMRSKIDGITESL